MQFGGGRGSGWLIVQVSKVIKTLLRVQVTHAVGKTRTSDFHTGPAELLHTCAKCNQKHSNTADGEVCINGTCQKQPQKSCRWWQEWIPPAMHDTHVGHVFGACMHTGSCLADK
jgi:hypothetical protein